MAEELDFADVAGVILGDDEVAVVVHGDLPDFAHFGSGGIVEPGTVARVGDSVAVEEEVDVARGVHVPNLAARVGGEEAGAGGKEPDAPHLQKTRFGRR